MMSLGQEMDHHSSGGGNIGRVPPCKPYAVPSNELYLYPWHE